jgi:hypothetical protein
MDRTAPLPGAAVPASQAAPLPRVAVLVDQTAPLPGAAVPASQAAPLPRVAMPTDQGAPPKVAIGGGREPTVGCCWARGSGRVTAEG